MKDNFPFHSVPMIIPRKNIAVMFAIAAPLLVGCSANTPRTLAPAPSSAVAIPPEGPLTSGLEAATFDSFVLMSAAFRVQQASIACFASYHSVTRCGTYFAATMQVSHDLVKLQADRCALLEGLNPSPDQAKAEDICLQAGERLLTVYGLMRDASKKQVAVLLAEQRASKNRETGTSQSKQGLGVAAPH